MNLLPEEKQKSVRKEYHLRLATVALFVVTGIFVAGSIFLLPSYVSVFSQYNDANAAIEFSQNNQNISDATTAKEMDELKKELALLSADTSDYVSDVFLLVTGSRNNIQVTGLSYEKNGAGVATVVVSGIAPSRQALQTFSKVLSGVYQFSEVRLPVSNFVEDKDISFTASLTLRGADTATIKKK